MPMDVSTLTAYHAIDSALVKQNPYSLTDLLRLHTLHVEGSKRYLHRVVEQTVTRKRRHTLTEHDMSGLTSPPVFIIVHTWQVIMHQ